MQLSIGRWALLASVIFAFGCAAPDDDALSDSEDSEDTEDSAQALSRLDWSPVVSVATTQASGLVGMGVGVAFRGRVVVAKGYGFEDREARVPVDPNLTQFRWASVSKTATGVLLTQLASEGRIRLDENVETRIPGYRVPPRSLQGDAPDRTLLAQERIITPRQLASHTGGIAHYTNGEGSPEPPASFLADPSRNRGMASALPFLTDKPLVWTPGERYSYSSFGFNLLGVALERASGLSFDALVTTRINVRAGTRIVIDQEASPASRRAVGYYRDGTQVRRRTASADVAWKAAGGGLLSSVADLTRYCGALEDERLLTKTQKSVAWTQQRIRSGSAINYGLGFNVSSTPSGPRVFHSGEQPKARTFLSLYPEKGVCVVIMTNAEYADIGSIANALDAAALRVVSRR